MSTQDIIGIFLFIFSISLIYFLSVKIPSSRPPIKTIALTLADTNVSSILLSKCLSASELHNKRVYPLFLAAISVS